MPIRRPAFALAAAVTVLGTFATPVRACGDDHGGGASAGCCDRGDRHEGMGGCCEHGDHHEGMGGCDRDHHQGGMGGDHGCGMGSEGASGSMSCDREGAAAGTGFGGWMARAERARYLGVRYLPALGGAANQYLVLTSGDTANARGVGWFHHGHEANLAIQLAAPNGTPWFVGYSGFVPSAAWELGPTKLTIGALIGPGLMLRTVGIAGLGGDFLQARLLGVLEPRVELGLDREGGWGPSVVASYLLTTSQADIGGGTIGVKFSFGAHHRHDRM